MATGNYCLPTDIDIRLGADNVNKWADINNNQVPAQIAARRAWACAQATSNMNDKLAGCRYPIPVQFTDIDAVPLGLRDATAREAGVLLYDSRGLTDADTDGNPVNRMTGHRKYVEQFVRDIWAAKRRLGSLEGTTPTYPTVVTDNGTNCPVQRSAKLLCNDCSDGSGEGIFVPQP